MWSEIYLQNQLRKNGAEDRGKAYAVPFADLLPTNPPTLLHQYRMTRKPKRDPAPAGTSGDKDKGAMIPITPPFKVPHLVEAQDSIDARSWLITGKNENRASTIRAHEWFL